MKYLLFIALFIISISPSYAMHFSKQECAVNWFDQGFQEGREGGPMRSLDRMNSECPRYGYQVNKPRYQEGWQQGRAQRQAREAQLCRQQENAFALGKSNQPYPDECTPDNYPSFKSEYDRGNMVGQRISVIQEKINRLNEIIGDRVRAVDLVQMDSGLYRLSSREKSAYAKVAVETVNDAVREKQPLEAELFNLQMIR